MSLSKFGESRHAVVLNVGRAWCHGNLVISEQLTNSLAVLANSLAVLAKSLAVRGWEPYTTTVSMIERDASQGTT